MDSLKIKILGNSGFIGQNILASLCQRFHISENDDCDVLINCAGFSRMYEGNNNIQNMIDVERSVLDKIKTLNFKKLIHLSTIYTSLFPMLPYCQVKLRIEDILLSQYNTTIFRLGNVIGQFMKKGVVFDILNDLPLYVTKDSYHNLITTSEITNIVSCIINTEINGIINVGAVVSISTLDIANALSKMPVYGSTDLKIIFNTERLQSLYKTKTSNEYLKDFINEVN